DGKNNTASCAQKISVVDTTDPTLVVPANHLAIECGSDTSPTANGTATGADACSSAEISFSDTFSTHCGQTRTISRLWKAIDACGNDTIGQQTLNTVDTTRPSITGPAEKTVECRGDITPTATGTATGNDTCGS